MVRRSREPIADPGEHVEHYVPMRYRLLINVHKQEAPKIRGNKDSQRPERRRNHTDSCSNGDHNKKSSEYGKNTDVSLSDLEPTPQNVGS